MAQGVQDTLLSINLLKVDHPTQNEIDLFIQAIQMNPAIVSLKGYANVNRELLTSVMKREILKKYFIHEIDIIYIHFRASQQLPFI